ncbi:hypothetical protein E2C01_047133 [Portunus trituberculatus]|uniref:Uncharacterized protein n=1 Tax=Portunus trituberculatus TaxID=210409 RepID=A0A5B7G9M3_PORTR|nr:hypothetical protein [Portunus trituberculatus]
MDVVGGTVSGPIEAVPLLPRLLCVLTYISNLVDAVPVPCIGKAVLHTFHKAWERPRSSAQDGTLNIMFSKSVEVSQEGM